MVPMFGVGLHFPVGELLCVRRIAVPGAIVEMAVATAPGAGLARQWGRALARTPLAEGALKAVHARQALTDALLRDVLGALAAARPDAEPEAGRHH